jgi:two-component system, cell cycle sensor histidine kinase and response regulator CckA
VAVGVVRDAAGRVTGYAESARDVTEFKRLQEQYRQAQKMEAVGQLAAGVAHDFNNLLTVIGGYSSLLLESLPADDKHREAAAEIREAGERAARLTGQLLAFSRQQVLDPVVLDLNEVAGHAGRLLERLIGEGVRVVLDLDRHLGKVRADAGQIEQVLMNLAVNARDAMPAGGRLTIATSNADLPAGVNGLPPGRYARLAVSDTGHGMPPDVLARVFEPFFTTKEAGKGTGLGLSTVFGIVAQSGGHVTVSSAIGAGTTFEIFLPTTASSSEEPSGIKSQLVRPARGTETVLLVEDDPYVRQFAAVALQMQGYTVVEAGTGAEAMAAAEAHADAIHIVVTDVVMPEMGGRQLTDALRGRRPGLKVLFVSGYPEDAVAQFGVAAGDQFLHKPFAPLALARKVRAVLDG